MTLTTRRRPLRCRWLPTWSACRCCMREQTMLSCCVMGHSSTLLLPRCLVSTRWLCRRYSLGGGRPWSCGSYVRPEYPMISCLRGSNWRTIARLPRDRQRCDCWPGSGIPGQRRGTKRTSWARASGVPPRMRWLLYKASMAA